MTKVQLSLSRESILPGRAYPNNLYEVPIREPSSLSPVNEGDMGATEGEVTNIGSEYERQGLSLPTPTLTKDYELQTGKKQQKTF